ncbi:hypothetical protein K501DRAFT_260802 [Backusella circina FSU 941]|nr:hypothetical protein K501DRAFT_260802 [Backusella circina FSU 941]
MPPRFQPTGPQQNQRPLQNEIITLNKILGTDILEQAVRILDHFATTKENKLDLAAFPTPTHLVDKLLEKCEDFETVCDQIYFVLEQSKRVLQLEWQQKIAHERAEKLEKDKQQLEKNEVTEDTEMEDGSMGLGFSSDMSLDDGTIMMDTASGEANHTKEQQQPSMDDEDMEELLQIQKYRLERLKNVIVLGMDAESVKASSRGGEKDDLLF